MKPGLILRKNVNLRKEPRFDCEYAARFRILSVPCFDSWPRTVHSCTVTNVSRSCLRFSLSMSELPEGAELEIRLKPAGLWWGLKFTGSIIRASHDPDAQLPLVVVDVTTSPRRTLSRWNRFLQRRFGRNRRTDDGQVPPPGA